MRYVMKRESVEFFNINQITITENYFLKKVDSTLVLGISNQLTTKG